MDKIQTGKRLKFIRELMGLTQEALGYENGFPANEGRTVRKWESEGIPPKHHLDVAKFFKIDPAIFLSEDISEKQLEKVILDPQASELFLKKIRQDNKIKNRQESQVDTDKGYNNTIINNYGEKNVSDIIISGDSTKTINFGSD